MSLEIKTIDRLVNKGVESSWDELHIVIDEINSIGKNVNFILFKTYCSLTIDGGGKFTKNYIYAHSENITSEQTSKDAVFKLIKHFNENYLKKVLVID